MKFRKTCTIGCLFVCAAFAQTEDGLKAKIATVRYPQLAESARIQGDVHLQVNSGVITLFSGHPVLTPLAIDNAKSLGSIQGQTKFDINYHFVLVETATSAPTTTTVKRGNALVRAIFRVLGVKTEKVVHRSLQASFLRVTGDPPRARRAFRVRLTVSRPNFQLARNPAGVR